jgi:FecR protein
MSFHSRSLLAVALGAAMIAPALAREVGDVQAVTRSAYGTPPDASKGAKRLGDPVADHEWLETLSASGMRVRMADGSQLTMGADSKVLVDAFVYDPAGSDSDAAAKAAISLPLGFLRYVTGSMPKGHTTIETPSATLTLRGTNVAVAVNQKGETLLVVDDGEVTVRSKLTGQEVNVGAGSSIDIKPQEIRKSEQSDTGDPAVDHGLGSSPKQQGNEERRGEHTSGPSRSGGTASAGDSGSDSGSDSSGGSDGGSNGG